MKRARLAVLILIAFCAFVPASQASAKVNAWQLPGGNIQCGYDHGSVLCIIYKQSFAKKPSCKGFYTAVGSVKRQGKSKVGVACYYGIPIVSGPPFHTLKYGHSIRRLGVTCYSFKAGMKCVNGNGHGFKLLKARAIKF